MRKELKTRTTPEVMKGSRLEALLTKNWPMPGMPKRVSMTMEPVRMPAAAGPL